MQWLLLAFAATCAVFGIVGRPRPGSIAVSDAYQALYAHRNQLPGVCGAQKRLHLGWVASVVFVIALATLTRVSTAVRPSPVPDAR